MCGSATFTIVASSTTMSWAVAITTSARPRWRLAGPAAEARPATGCGVDMGLLANGRRNPAPRPGGRARLFYLLLQFLAGGGEDEPLNPAVTGIAFPRGQSAFLQHVRDACHERRVTVHPPSKVLHGQRPVEHVQRLDEEGRHLEGLGHPLAPGQEFGDQPDYRVENVEVELVFVRSNVHRAPLSACAYGLPVSYSTVE